jgi:hypothetical protein
MCFVYFGVKKGNGEERRRKREERRRNEEERRRNDRQPIKCTSGLGAG